MKKDIKCIIKFKIYQKYFEYLTKKNFGNIAIHFSFYYNPNFLAFEKKRF